MSEFLTLNNMSDICIYLDVEPYLKQWFINDMGNEHPISLIRNSAESDIIRRWLTVLPPEKSLPVGNTDMLAIYLPKFNELDAEQNYYLPIAALKLLKQCIRNRFVIELWRDLNDFGFIGFQKQDVIYAWMEQHGIDDTETNFNAIQKIYQRKRNTYKKLKNRKKMPKFKSKK